MKVITINAHKIKNIFEELTSSFSGNISFDSDEYTLDVNNEFSKGSIVGSSFNDNIFCLQFDMIFSEDTRISISNPQISPVYFAYCSKGNLSHSFGLSGVQRKLKKFQTAIVSSRKDENNILFFEKNVNTKLTLIVVGTQDSNTHQNILNHSVKETFFQKNNLENFFYVGSYNLKIAEKIEQLNAVSQTGIVRNLLKEGILKIILAMEIQQHSDDMKNPVNETNCLTLREMEEIKELSDFIQNNPEEQFTIKSLSKKSGLSPNKLQEGFKMIHDRTVNDFITHMRILKAEILIRNSDMNISEIVYCIGFTSRSYFSKIFKQKYNCSPKEYKFKQSPLAITA